MMMLENFNSLWYVGMEDLGRLWEGEGG